MDRHIKGQIRCIIIYRVDNSSFYRRKILYIRSILIALFILLFSSIYIISMNTNLELDPQPKTTPKLRIYKQWIIWTFIPGGGVGGISTRQTY